MIKMDVSSVAGQIEQARQLSAWLERHGSAGASRHTPAQLRFIIERDHAEAIEHDSTIPPSTERIVKRAQYDALKMMLVTLDEWQTVTTENLRARGLEDDASFTLLDIKAMVIDAARALGVRMPSS